METIEKASATEISVITTTSTTRTISLKSLKERRAEIEGSLETYPAQKQRELQQWIDEVNAELNKVNELIIEAGRLSVVEAADITSNEIPA